MAWAAGDTFTTSRLNGVSTSYTCAWTSDGTQPAIGNGSISATYSLVGRRVLFYIVITMGSTTTFGTNNYYVSLPSIPIGPLVGMVYIIDSGTAYHVGTPQKINDVNGNPSNTIAMVVENKPTTAGQVSPHVWANTDVLLVSGEYFV